MDKFNMEEVVKAVDEFIEQYSETYKPKKEINPIKGKKAVLEELKSVSLENIKDEKLKKIITKVLEFAEGKKLTTGDDEEPDFNSVLEYILFVTKREDLDIPKYGILDRVKFVESKKDNS